MAMSRTLGDLGVKPGMTYEPEVSILDIEEDMRFVLICSDGVWEYTDEHEVLAIVARHGPDRAQEAAMAVAEKARVRYLENEGGVVDDITAMVIWLNESRMTLTDVKMKAHLSM